MRFDLGPRSFGKLCDDLVCVLTQPRWGSELRPLPIEKDRRARKAQLTHDRVLDPLEESDFTQMRVVEQVFRTIDRRSGNLKGLQKR